MVSHCTLAETHAPITSKIAVDHAYTYTISIIYKDWQWCRFSSSNCIKHLSIADTFFPNVPEKRSELPPQNHLPVRKEVECHRWLIAFPLQSVFIACHPELVCLTGSRINWLIRQHIRSWWYSKIRSYNSKVMSLFSKSKNRRWFFLRTVVFHNRQIQFWNKHGHAHGRF